MKSLLFLSVALCLPHCGIKPRGSLPANVEIQRLQQLEYDSLQLTVVRDAQLVPTIDKTITDKNSAVKASLSVGTYTFDLVYKSEDQIVASSLLCNEDDQKSRTHSLKSGPNKIKVIVCGQQGEEIEADVNIEPVLKDPGTQKPVTNGAQLYKEQCSSCHGEDGMGAEIAGPVKGPQCKSCDTRENQIQKILTTMPIQSPESCDEDCAEAITDYLRGDSQ